MSLVGTRPPTVDEWEKYELHHRSRMSTKPGITGMWQVSGRSDITDFEEVVRLDTEYIEQPDVIDKMRIKSVDSEELILTEGSMLIASAKKSENREAFFYDRELMTYEQLTNK